MRGGRRTPVDAVAAFAAVGLLVASVASAQAPTVVFDDSFGNPGPADTLPFGTGVDYRIDYCPSCSAAELPGGSHGQLVGTGLFQSLLQLDVNDGDAATFAVSEGVPVDNIFARVTGGASSQIFGLLRSEVVDANVYLLNPYGVVFGPTAQLDVGSSFVVSTADELQFAGGESFGTHAGGTVPTIAADPVSFGFWVDAAPPATVSFDRTQRFAAADGAVLSAVAGEVVVDGSFGVNTIPTLESSGGQIQLVAAPAGTNVPLDAAAVDVSTLGTDAAVRLGSNAILRVSGSSANGPGRIVIRGGRFETVQPAGFAESATVEAFDTGAGPVPAIDIEVAGVLSLDAAVIESVTNARDESGDIGLKGDEVLVTDGSEVIGRIDRTLSGLAGPAIHIDARVAEITGGSKLKTSDDIGTGLSFGDVGDITVEGDSITVSGDGTEISSVNQGSGDAATIRLDAADRVEVKDGAEVFTNRLTSLRPAGVPDDFGAIEVLGNEVLVADGAEIRAQTSTALDGADVRVGTAADPVGTLDVLGGAIGSVTVAAGKGGDVSIYAGDVVVASSAATPDATAQISALTTRQSKTVGGDGPGGNLTIVADSLSLIDGGQVRATTEGSEDAGDMVIDVAGTLLATGQADTLPGEDNRPSGIFARSAQYATPPGDPVPAPPTTGGGGQLDITATDIVVEAGAVFSARAESQGPAGDLTITSQTLRVEGAPGAASEISTKGATGPGGNLTIDTGVLQVFTGGLLSASSTGLGGAGDIDVTARDVDIAGDDTGVFAQSVLGAPGVGRAGSVTFAPPDGETLTMRVRDGGRVSVESAASAAGKIQILDASLLEITNGGQISATVTTVNLQPGETPEEIASDIRILDAGTVRIADGSLDAETVGSALGGSIEIDAVDVSIIDGSTVTAQSVSALQSAGDAGSIDIAASNSLEIADSTITTQAAQGAGGDITLSGANSAFVSDGSAINALAEGAGAAGNILVEDMQSFEMTSGSSMTAETSGSGPGGQILFQDVDSLVVSDGSSVTTRSTALGGGAAGSIVMAVNDKLKIEKSEVTTTAVDAGGGRISMQAGSRVYLLDSTIETTVQGADDVAGNDAGDIDIPLREDDVPGLDPVLPDFVVINGSTVRANAVATDAGNITIAALDVLVSRDSVIEATSETGVSGTIEITSPDADVVSQVTALPSSFVDPSDRLLPPCVARTERTGSFVVQGREAIPAAPDAPLSPHLGAPGGASPARDSVECSVVEESS